MSDPVLNAAKVIYIIMVEDPSVKNGIDSFLCSKKNLRQGAEVIEITGVPFNNSAKNKNITTVQAEKLFEDAAGVNIIVPWQRVISIKNLSYKQSTTRKTK